MAFHEFSLSTAGFYFQNYFFRENHLGMLYQNGKHFVSQSGLMF